MCSEAIGVRSESVEHIGRMGKDFEGLFCRWPVDDPLMSEASAKHLSLAEEVVEALGFDVDPGGDLLDSVSSFLVEDDRLLHPLVVAVWTFEHVAVILQDLYRFAVSPWGALLQACGTDGTFEATVSLVAGEDEGLLALGEVLAPAAIVPQSHDLVSGH